MRFAYAMHSRSASTSAGRSTLRRWLLVALLLELATGTLHAQPAWVPSGLNNTMVYSVASDHQGVMLAAAQTGIFRSTDNGRSWLATGSTSPAHTVSISPEGIGFATYFDSRVGGDAIARSSDTGATWIPQTPLTRSARGVEFDVEGRPIALRGDSLFRSSDDGITWEPLGREGFTSSFFDIHLLAVTPTGDLFLGNRGITGGLVFISVDGGASWQQIYNAGSDITVLESTPNGTLLLATPDRFIRSTDGGESWTPVPGVTGSPSQMSIHGDEIHIVADGIHRSTDEGATWTRVAELPSLPANGRVTGLTTAPGGELVVATSNGIHRLSTSASVERAGGQAGDLAIHPNPVHGEGMIVLPAPVRSSCRIELVDIQGRGRALIATDAPPGTRQIEWRSDGLADGLYMIRIDLDGAMLSRMIVVAR